MTAVGVFAIIVVAWLLISIGVALAIGRMVRRANEDARLYGSFLAPPPDQHHRRSATTGDSATGNDESGAD